MATITKTIYGYSNSPPFNWGVISKETYKENIATLLNDLWTEQGDIIWASVKPISETETEISFSNLMSNTEYCYSIKEN